MTTEQLNQARAEAWRQAGNPLLTADDAAAWLRETGVSLFLPRAQQLATAAPSFVEAVLGASDATPPRETIETATGLLHRLLASGDAIALNLLGTPGEQPDFLVTTETLPFLFTLIGDKEWKRGPRGKSSPLVIEVWKLLDREGPLTTIEVKEKLGRQLTEVAALRALTELWSHLRIEPILKEGESAAWQLLERGRQKCMQAGSTMSQAVALSALVSLYLQSAVAASGDEIEIFLSPLASRSKVREAVRGLTATRQLSTLNLGPVEMYHVEGSLPEFAEIEQPQGAVVAISHQAPSDDAEGIGEGRRRFVAKRLAAESGEASAAPDAKRAPRPSAARDRTSAGRAGDAEQKDRRPFAPRPGTEAGARKPYGTRSPGSSFNPREPWKEDRKPGPDGEDRRPFAQSREKASGERKPFTPREGGPGERKSFAPRNGDRPFKPRSDAKPFGERKSFGERKPFTPGEGGERKAFTPREGGAGERRPFAPRSGDRPFKPRSDAKPFGERKSFPPREGGERRPSAPRGGDRSFKPRSDAKPFGERKSFGDRKPSSERYPPREGGPGERKPFAAGERPFKPRASGERKPFAPREGSGERKPSAARGDRPFKPRFDAKPSGERRSFTPRDTGERKPDARNADGGNSSAPRDGKRPFKPRSDSRPSTGSGEARPAYGAARPSSPGTRKPTGFRKTAAAGRARTAPMTSTGKPRSGVKPPLGRPGPRATRGGAAGAPGRVKGTGRPAKGRSK